MATVTQTKNTYIGPLKSIDVTFSEINTLTNSAAESTVNVTVSGARVGMIPVVSWVNALTTGVVMKQSPIVSAADTVSIFLFNELTTKVTPDPNSVHVRIL